MSREQTRLRVDVALGCVRSDRALRKPRDDQVQGFRAFYRCDVAGREYTLEVGLHEAVDGHVALVRKGHAPAFDRPERRLESEAQQDDIDVDLFLFAGLVVVNRGAIDDAIFAVDTLDLP